MKKLFSLMLLMSFAFSFVSCNSDDDSNEPQFTIVGSWKISGKLINGVEQNISNECVYKGKLTFVNGGAYTEELWTEEEGNPCHFSENIGGTWVKDGNSYKITISTPDVHSILPQLFTPEIDNSNLNQFKVSETSLGTTTTLVFTKQ